MVVVVSMFVFHSDDQSSNPADFVKLFEKYEDEASNEWST